MSAQPVSTPDACLSEPVRLPEFGAAARRGTRQVRVGGVALGGDAPVVVQSMTNTDTADVAATARQIGELWRAGSELVRITVNNPESAAAVPRIVERLAMQGIEVPIIGDFHYNGHQLLAGEPACAEALAKYRINPGNVGFGRKKDLQFAQLIEFAMRYGKPEVGARIQALLERGEWPQALSGWRRAELEPVLAPLLGDVLPAAGRSV